MLHFELMLFTNRVSQIVLKPLGTLLQCPTFIIHEESSMLRDFMYACGSLYDTYGSMEI